LCTTALSLSLQLISNVIFAPYLSDETISKNDVVATGLIVVGAIVSVAFANHEEQAKTFDEIFAYFDSPRFLMYAMAIGSISFALIRFGGCASSFLLF
jgi:hypothetical protein